MSILAVAPLTGSAAGSMLYFGQSTGTFSINENFTVNVKVDTAGNSINAGEGTIGFDKDTLEVVSLSRNGSLFSLWPVEPSFSNTDGIISFGGGTPTGYSGPGGNLLAITFKAKRAGAAQVRFTSGAVLANDSKGSNILQSLGMANYTISPQAIVTGEAGKAAETGKDQPAATKQLGGEYNLPNITSETHPDQNKWSNSNLARFKWALPDSISAVSYVFSRESDAVPGNAGETPISEKEFKDIDDGIWYFHLKFKDAKGWGGTAHYRIMIDCRPPSAFEVVAEKAGNGDWPTLKFSSNDEVSGLDHYEIFVGSLEHQSHRLSSEESSLKLSSLSIGKHTALVKATDKAGNERISSLEFYVDPIETPQIADYSKEIRSSEGFFINGKSLPDVTVKIYFERDGRIVHEAETKSDASGNWFAVAKDGLANGRYVVWSEAINDKGIHSGPSGKIGLLVSPPVFMIVGDLIINYFTVVISLLFALFLIIFGSLYLSKRFKRRGVKESSEVETVVRQKLVEYQELINDEFDKAKKAGTVLTDEKMQVNLKKKLREAEKKILKEVRDVEVMFKG